MLPFLKIAILKRVIDVALVNGWRGAGLMSLTLCTLTPSPHTPSRNTRTHTANLLGQWR